MELDLADWVISGHEATGVVVQKGEDVRGLEIGSRIAIENHFYCEDCYSCKVIILKKFLLFSAVCSLCNFPVLCSERSR